MRRIYYHLLMVVYVLIYTEGQSFFQERLRRSCRDVRGAKAPSTAHVCDPPCLSMRNTAHTSHRLPTTKLPQSLPFLLLVCISLLLILHLCPKRPPYPLQKPLRNRRKCLIPLPHQIKPVLQRRFERPERKPAPGSRIQELVKCKQITQMLFCEHRCVVSQPERAFQMQLSHFLLRPPRNIIFP